MKKIFLFLFLCSLFSQLGIAQEETTTIEEAEPATTTHEAAPHSISKWSVGLSILQWSEILKIQQGVSSEHDVANYNALSLALEKEITYLRWGWNIGAFLGSGRAVGGGNSSLIPYEKSKVAFTVYGLSPRIFYRLSSRINAGFTAIAFMKNVDWPKDAAIQEIDSGQKINITPLADLNIRLFQNWNFYTGIGPIVEGATLWKLGLNYRY